jgi:hypothetical protein
MALTWISDQGNANDQLTKLDAEYLTIRVQVLLGLSIYHQPNDGG